jgi:hypothetical protein
MPVWDEAVYLGIGKFIYSSGISGLWEVIRPLGLPLIIGLYWFLGLNQIFFSELTAIIFSIATIFVTYLIGKKIFDKHVGIIASFLITIFPVYFFYSGIIMTEIPSTFFVLLAVYFFIENRLILAGAASGLSFMFKFPQGIIFPVLIIMLAIKHLIINKTSKSKFLKLADKIFFTDMVKLVIPFFLISSVFFIFNYFAYIQFSSSVFEAAFKPIILGGAHQNNIYQGVLNSSLESHLYNAFYYFIVILKNDIVLLIGLIAFIILYFKDKLYKNEKITLIFFGLIVYLAYYSYIIIKQERFTNMFLPFICIIASYVFLISWKKRKKSIYRVIISVVFSLILIFSSVHAIASDIRFYAWQNKRSDEPIIVKEIYRSFEGRSIQGPILTTDPIFVVYSDKRFIPFYDTTQEKGFINSWESQIKANAIIYVNSSFPCLNPVCITDRTNRYESISNLNVLIYNNSFGHTNYQIFIPMAKIQ